MRDTGIVSHTTRDDAENRASQIRGHVHQVPNSSCWASFPADKSPADLPAWFPGFGARSTDPSTSHDAAARAQLTAGSDRAMVLRIHQANTAGGLTDFELAEIAGRSQTSVGKRRGELRDIGLIRDSGLKRPAPSGALSVVWLITAEGRATRTDHIHLTERKAS